MLLNGNKMNKNKYLQIVFEFNRIKMMPIHIFFFKLFKKILGFFIGIIFLPLTALLHFLGFRHVTIFVQRIGHLALETDCLIKENLQGIIPHKKWILLSPHNHVSNNHFLNYLKYHHYNYYLSSH